MKELTLKFEDKTVTINTHEIEGQTLYNLNDILKQYNPNNIDKVTRYTKHLTPIKESFYLLLVKKGRNGGTYVNQRGVIWFASKLSQDFEMAVIEAFEAAANGDGNRAVDIATSKVITPELLNKLQFWTPLLHKEITVWSNKNKKGKFGYTQIYNHIINKCVANIYTKELKKSHDVKSMKDYLIKQNNVEGLGAYIAMCEMLVPLLQANADYDFLKKLFIETPNLYKAA
ncbi:hypothetical protein CGT68_17840 [Vibrio cholerae]|uniref:hypothetical protein n=1 Tax=Vibrio cholerae TaxID=666 RepID=UPI000BA9C7E4|nr:hypothetical protein [Vibrio cholerae]PAS39885.1 hypothetical protein CGT68_17840 [Vibrio cholerae]PAS40338.1 hypothetical protein CGT69_14760 [Vibrio cholerae]